MNAPLPMSATSPERLSVLPDAWIEKIFQRFEDFFGAKWAAQYGSFPRDRVKRTWAEELAGFSDKPEAIARALKNLGPFPPTLPEFKALLRESARSIGEKTPALTHQPTPEERQRSRESAEAVSRTLKAKSSDGIDAHWATHPRGEMHLKFIFDAAKKDQRFRPCIAEMVKDGICTEDGHLLKHYRDRQFFRAGSA